MTHLPEGSRALPGTAVSPVVKASGPAGPGGLTGSRVALVAPPAVATVAVAAAVSLGDTVIDRAGLAGQDPVVAGWFAAHRSPALDVLANVLSFAGSELSIGGLTVLLIGYLWWRRQDRTAAILVAAAMGVSGALTLGLKALVARPRPPADMVLGPVDTTFSFPSGHSLNTAVFFGVFVVVAIHRLGLGGWAGGVVRSPVGVLSLWHRTAGLAMVVSVAILLSIGVAASRLYLGYHWLTDVLASEAIAVAITAAVVGASFRLLLGAATVPSAREALGPGPDNAPAGHAAVRAQ